MLNPVILVKQKLIWPAPIRHSAKADEHLCPYQQDRYWRTKGIGSRHFFTTQEVFTYETCFTWVKRILTCRPFFIVNQPSKNCKLCVNRGHHGLLLLRAERVEKNKGKHLIFKCLPRNSLIFSILCLFLYSSLWYINDRRVLGQPCQPRPNTPLSSCHTTHYKSTTP